jgi:hypothetical protein
MHFAEISSGHAPMGGKHITLSGATEDEDYGYGE